MKEKKPGKSANPAPRVLILDDDTNLRKSLTELVASAGHQPVQAATGRQALALAEKQAFDAALIDLNLADMPGLEVLKQLKEKNPGTECILITGYASQETAIAAIDLDVFAYIQKPYNVDQLLLTLRHALEKSRGGIALQQSEKRYREIAGLISDYAYAFTVTEKGKLVREWVSPSFREITGYDVGEFREDEIFSQLIDPRDLPIAQTRAKRMFAGKRDISEFRILTKSGETRWLRDHGIPQLDDTGTRVIRLVGAAKDITDYKNAQHAAEESDKRLLSVLEDLSDAVYAHDLDGRIIYVNQLSCSMTGYTREELLDKMVWDIDPLIRDQFDLQALWNNLKPNEVKVFELEHQRKDASTFPVEVHIRPMDYQNRRIILATARDITRRRKTEEDMQKGLEFQRVLMELATRIVNVPAEEVDSAIHESLAIVGNFTGVDRAYLFRFNQHAGTVNNTHEWCARGIPSVISQLQDIPAAMLPEWIEAHQRGEPFIMPRVSGLRKNSKIRKLLEMQDIQTVASVPLLDRSRLLGFVGFDSVRIEREWSRAELDLLKVLAALLTNILLRWERVEALVLNEEKLSSIFRAAPIGIGMVVDRVFTEVNQRLCELTGYEREELIGQSARMLYPIDADYDFVGDKKYRQINETGIGEVETVFRRKDGAVIHVLLRSSPVDREDLAKGVTFTVLDIGERKRVENALRSSETRFRELFQDAPVAYQVLDAEGRIMDVNNRWCQLLGYSVQEVAGKSVFDLMAHREQDSARASFKQKLEYGVVYHEGSEQAFVTKTGENRLLRSAFYINRDDQGKMISTLVTIEDFTEVRQRERELAVLVNVSTALRTAETRDELLPALLDQIIKQLHVDGATLEMLDPASGDFIIELGSGIWKSVTGLHIPAGKGISARVLASGQPYLNNRADKDPDLFKPELFAGCRAAAGMPLKAQERIIGLLWVGSARDLGEGDLRLLGALADMAANAIQRITLHEQTEQRIAQVNALRTIEQTINSNLDLRVILNVILQQAEGLLDADALSFLLYSPATLRLKTAASSGFRTNANQSTNLLIGQGFAGRAALERRLIRLVDLNLHTSEIEDKEFFKIEEFQAYHAIPLIVKAEIKGVLEVFHRAPFTPNEEWLDNFQTLAAQTAIAVNNQEMFDGLQRLSANLTITVEDILVAWARSLEIRAGKTEYDPRRLVDLTLRLVRAAGMKDADSAHLLLGTILHDLGETAIPEAVLRKPGPLDEEEWELVRAHPQTAYDLLHPIRHLRPALDVPYCHHEKWDGSGYPRGLKDEAIPLAARVFAVVDVYDALISERPYRPAFSPKKSAGNHPGGIRQPF